MRCVNPRPVSIYRTIEYTDKFGDEADLMMVPCGKCLVCLQKKRREWSFRLEQEFKYSQGAFFVTLTYDQKHYPGTLRKKDFQLFMKRLRKADATNKLRYYAVGEYGSKEGRAHYHVLLFNLQDEALVRRSWCDVNGKPIGIVHIGKVTAASIGYCTKYIVQPMEPVEGMEKPFALMSRKFGIGGKYLTDEMVQWHREDLRNYGMRFNEKVALPRFYKDKIWPLVKESIVADRWQVMREELRTKSKIEGIKQAELEAAYFEKKYGELANEKMNQFRQAVLTRVKRKVEYTQKF